MIRGLKIRKKGFKFCRRDEYGVRPYPGGRVMVKPTLFGYEMLLRMKFNIIKRDYYTIKGIREWDAYREHLPSITTHLADIRAAIMRYKARRIERSIIHLVPIPNSIGFRIISPFNSPPGARRDAAIQRWKRRRKKRKAIAAAARLKGTNDDDEQLNGPTILARLLLVKPSTAWYFSYLVSIAVLSCAIIFL
ncbi:hypothetical protein QOZ80_3AG0208160 [Eleusine coracana subsp. coracana]|nr:hypothetical protein QOZ80_3AG0208160 [Eleusine coracana subsp. coracana]